MKKIKCTVIESPQGRCQESYFSILEHYKKDQKYLHIAPSNIFLKDYNTVTSMNKNIENSYKSKHLHLQGVSY